MTNLKDFAARALPGQTKLSGQYVDVVPFSADHLPQLSRHILGPAHESLWDYLPIHPPKDEAALAAFIERGRDNGWITQIMVAKEGPYMGQAIGTMSYMRQRPEHGSCEVGCVIFSPALRQTRMATEALYLMAAHVFDELAYRRFEWKCNNENAGSKAAAIRFGFLYEGIFRNDMVVKGKNRDTAWFAITDGDWPNIKDRFVKWLAPNNFSADGQQIKKLSDFA